MIKIRRFKEINDLLEFTGFNKRSENPDFYILKFEDIPVDSIYHMSPYQKDFYQVGFIVNTDSKTNIHLDNQNYMDLPKSIFFVSPDHIYSWTRSEKVTGFILYFKASYFNFYQGDINKEFTFFNLTETNAFSLKEDTVSDLAFYFEKLFTENNTQSLYKYQILQSSLLSLLFKIKGLEEIETNTSRTSSSKELLVYQYQNLVINCFRVEKQIKNYAEKLHISVSYLNQILKEIKGKTAKELLLDYTCLQAKKELKYTSISISEIAFELGFEEPTHFTRFFKKQTGFTPNQFRKNN